MSSIDKSASQSWPEGEYLEYLDHERHMYAWCLQTYGDLEARNATAEALEFYKFEPPTDPLRGLLFHDSAWHWAMLRIVGDLYWHSRPELSQPSTEYDRESERFDLRSKVVSSIEWFLMGSQFPNLNWARLRTFSDGTADVFDMDGTLHEFTTHQQARNWLSGGEFVAFLNLDDEALSDQPFALPDIIPPKDTGPETLLQCMFQKWDGAGWTSPKSESADVCSPVRR